MPRRDLRDLAQLLSRKAAADEAALGKLLDDADVPDEVIGFHAQQTVEKLIKAVLAHLGIPPPRSHDIGYLISLLADRGLPAPPDPADLEALNPWAAAFRYEDTFGHNLDRDATAVLVRAVRRWADSVMHGSA